jgi:hypothetical protein
MTLHIHNILVYILLNKGYFHIDHSAWLSTMYIMEATHKHCVCSWSSMSIMMDFVVLNSLCVVYAVTRHSEIKQVMWLVEEGIMPIEG